VNGVVGEDSKTAWMWVRNGLVFVVSSLVIPNLLFPCFLVRVQVVQENKERSWHHHHWYFFMRTSLINLLLWFLLSPFGRVFF
jgi:hypothetical protein